MGWTSAFLEITKTLLADAPDMRNNGFSGVFIPRTKHKS